MRCCVSWAAGQAVCVVLALSSLCASPANAQVVGNTGPSYQGHLKSNGQPANGLYDIRLTPKSSGGFSGVSTTHNSVMVSDGLFSIENAFSVGNSDSYDLLEVAVRPAGSGQAFTVLSPLSTIGTVPYAKNTSGIVVVDETVGVGIVGGEPVARLHVADNENALALSPGQFFNDTGNERVDINFYGNFPELGDPADATIRYSEFDNSLSLFTGPVPSLTLVPSAYADDGGAYLAGADLQLLGFVPTLSLTPTFPAGDNIPLSRIIMGSTTTGGEAAIEWYQNSDRLIFSSPQGSSQGIQMRLDTGGLGINTDPNDLGAALAVASDLAIVAVESTSGSPSGMSFSAVGLTAEARLTFDPNPSRPSFSIDLDETGGIPFADFIVEGGQISMLNGLVYISDLSLNVAESARDNDDLIISQSDATLGLYSSTLGTFGSQITLKEISGSSLTNNWGIIRETSSFGASLQFRYGSDANSGFNTLLLELDPVEGSLRLGGVAGTVSDYRLVLPNSANGGGRAVANRWDTYSSARFKTNISTIPNALVTLGQLRGVTFDWLPEHAPAEGPVHDLGFIAEEVAKVLPDAVSVDASGRAEALDYARVMPLAVEAIKQQQRQIDAQREEIDRLNARLERLEAMLSE